jgi:hypothetical protein
MASRIEFAISATPIYSFAAGEGTATDAIAADVGRSLAGGASVAVTWGSTVGWAAGVPTYIAATSATSLGTFTSHKGIWIRHTGFSDAGLVTPTTANLTVLVSATAFCQLPPGGAIFLPHVAGFTPTLTATATGGTIQVEVMGTA